MKLVIKSLSAAYFQIPLKNPFVISIRTATYANVIRLRLETDDGQFFLGECVPVQYVTGETPDTVLAAIPAIEALIKGHLVEDLEMLIDLLARQFPNDIAARAGVEIALYTAFATQIDVPAFKLLGAQKCVVETDLTIARIPNATDVAMQAWDAGFRIFKMKVGGGEMQEDIDRVMGIVALRPDAILRLDANQSLTVEGAVRLASELLSRGAKIELMEQPVPKEDFAALARVAELSPVPILADEACRSASDAFEIFSKTNVQGVNVKLMKSGIRGALDIIRVAKATGRKLMIGCMLESEVGMAASVALACGTGAFNYIDLDGHLLLNLEAPIALFQAQGPQLFFA